MSNKKQTAVEWLESIEMERDLNLGDWRKAKEMGKEQIMDGWDNGFLDYQISMHEDAEQYYKETYE
jgi:hypothetical protein